MNLQDDPFLTLGASLAVGCLHGFDLLEQPLVGGITALPGEVVPGRSTVALQRSALGRQVILFFEHGDPRKPIILGVVTPAPGRQPARSARAPVQAEVDGERRIIEAQREIVLRCGEASITLTRAGKILIQGSYILSRSTGYNRIKGAAVDIN